MQTKKLLKNIALPIIVLAIFLSFVVTWKYLALPEKQEFIEMARGYFDTYGYLVVFISAIIEGTLWIALYYPGSLVIFLGVIFAGEDLGRVAGVVVVTTLGLMVAYIFDYALGKYGWYKLLLKFGLRESVESAQKKLLKHGPKFIYLGFWHPNFAAVIATAAGILDFGFKKFLKHACLAASFWSIFWGTVAYFLGEMALIVVGMRFAVVFIFFWLLYRVIVGWKQK